MAGRVKTRYILQGRRTIIDTERPRTNGGPSIHSILVDPSTLLVRIRNVFSISYLLFLSCESFFAEETELHNKSEMPEMPEKAAHAARS